MNKVYFLCIALACMFIATGCCSTSKMASLSGKWKIVTYMDDEEIEVSCDKSYTLQFHDTGMFSLTTDCNTISGEYSYSVSKRNLQFGNLTYTEKACENEIVEQSLKYQLPMVKTYNLPNDTTLYLLGKNGKVLIQLAKVIN